MQNYFYYDSLLTQLSLEVLSETFAYPCSHIEFPFLFLLIQLVPNKSEMFEEIQTSGTRLTS